MIDILRRIGLAACLCFATSIAAHADTFSFTGNFNQDDDVQLFHFTVGSTSTVTLRSLSYAGGTQADGHVVARGGFDPILALFDAAGNLIGQNDDDNDGVVPPDAVTGQRYDTYLSSLLGAGSYVVSVMQYNNFAIGPTLAAGFRRDGQGNFTATLNGGCGASRFCDAANDARDSHWAFDIGGVNSASTVVTPIPAAMPLLLSGMAGLGVLRLRRNQPAA